MMFDWLRVSETGANMIVCLAGRFCFVFIDFLFKLKDTPCEVVQIIESPFKTKGNGEIIVVSTADTSDHIGSVSETLNCIPR